jgi:serpin B
MTIRPTLPVSLVIASLAAAPVLGSAVGCGSDSEPSAEDRFGSMEVAAEYDRKISELVDEEPGSDLGANAQAFSVDIMERAVAGATDDNIMVSPLSVMLALSMTMNGADTTTLEAMLSGLGFEGLALKEVNTYLHQVVRALAENEELTLEIANSIWVREDYQPLKRSFYEIVRDYYDAGIFPLAGPGPINEWVTDATHDKITDIVSELPPDTAMVLVNAIYFNGTWLDPFDTDRTDTGEFHAAGGAVRADMMHTEGEEVSYKRGRDYQAVAIPYKDENTSLYVFLPDEESSLGEFYENTLAAGGSGGYHEYSWDTNDWKWVEDGEETLFSNFGGAEVVLSLPKFSFEFDKSLKDDLIALGMEEIFSDRSDFTNFSEGKNPFVVDVIHKTFIEVNEEGTEAAAVTAVIMADTAAAFTVSMIVDRPFFFCIRDDETGVILFMGQVTDPTK